MDSLLETILRRLPGAGKAPLLSRSEAEAFVSLPSSSTADMLAVAALDEGGQPVGMAGASRDGERLWQIGVNVLPSHRGRGLAAGLTALLKDELLRRGIVPFYGTAQSHIFSLNTARNAGFRPAWAEVWARPL